MAEGPIPKQADRPKLRLASPRQKIVLSLIVLLLVFYLAAAVASRLLH